MRVTPAGNAEVVFDNVAAAQTRTPSQASLPSLDSLGSLSSLNSNTSKPSIKLASKRTIKIRGCAYHVAFIRGDNFSKFALLAAACTTILALVKYMLALQGEKQAARESLQNTGKTVANTLKLQLEADFAALDAVANLWHLDSKLSRHEYRKYIMSEYFAPRLQAMETIMLVQRVKAHQRAAYENDAAGAEVRRQCCNGTTYDVPTTGSVCRERARNQCKISGAHRYYFTEVVKNGDGKRNVAPASANRSDMLIIMYQEPLELNPGPMGLDLGSLPSRKAAFVEAEETGNKGITKRVKRVFADRAEFGLLVWNNVFVCGTTDGNKTFMQGISLGTKKKIAASCDNPYAIGSVVAVYKPQVMLATAISKIFGREVADTRVYLFDERPTMGSRERLLAMYDQTMSNSQMNDEAVAISERTVSELTESDDSQLKRFTITGTRTGFSVAVVPSEDYMSKHTTQYPKVILVISLCLVFVSQAERWLGHPSLISHSTLTRAHWESIIRSELENEIVQAAAAKACEEGASH